MAYKNKNIFREGPFFTHFASLPLLDPTVKNQISSAQSSLRQLLHAQPEFASLDILREHSSNLAHITFFKLILRHNSMREKLGTVLENFKQQIIIALKKIPVKITGVNYFTRFNKNAKSKQITVIYLEISEEMNSVLIRLCDKIIRELLKQEIIVSHELKDMNVVYDHNSNLFKPETFHISLFRAANLLENEKFLKIFGEFKDNFKKISSNFTSFDISTMKQYDQEGFYFPLIRIPIQHQQ